MKLNRIFFFRGEVEALSLSHFSFDINFVFFLHLFNTFTNRIT